MDTQACAPQACPSLKRAALVVLRAGLATTFVWIGLFILQDPMKSASLILPWALPLMPLPLETLMLHVAVLDIVIGLMFLQHEGAWYGSLLSVLHLLLVLLVTGITAVTVRNIGLLAASAALLMSLPVPHLLTALLEGAKHSHRVDSGVIY